MINNTKNLLRFLMSNYIDDVDVAIDLTAGNGYDCKTILEELKPQKLYAFDIQSQAKTSTLKLLGDHGFNLDNFEFIVDSHENIDSYIHDKIDFAIYNLGYLPKSDHTITTDYKRVIKSIEALFPLLNHKGIILMTFYPGHKQGLEESEHIPNFLKKLNQNQYTVLKFEFINQKNNPPFCIMIQVRK